MTTSTSTTQGRVQAKLLWRLGRQWQVGDRLPPIKDLARELGTGQSNTHEAVRQLAATGVLRSRQRRGTFVARLPLDRPATRPDDSLRCRTVAVVLVKPVLDPFISHIAASVTREVLGSEGVVQTLDLPAHQPVPLLDADAVVVINPVPPLVIERHPWQPAVVVSTAWHAMSELPAGIDAVGINDHQGGLLAGQAMARLGCTEVGFIGASPQWDRFDVQRLDMTSTARLGGFEAGWGRPVSERWIMGVPGYSIHSGGKAFGQYQRLGERPRALFAASDDLALGFCSAAAAAGLRAGTDFHIIGFDGQERALHLVDGGLTTVAAPVDEMGRRAVQLIRERFSQPDRPDHRLQLNCSLRGGASLPF
jgi:hypothetical protein